MYTVQSTVRKTLVHTTLAQKVLVVQKHYHNSCVNKLSSGISTILFRITYYIELLKQKQLGVKVHSIIASLSVSQVAIDDLSSPAAVKLLLSPLFSCATYFDSLVLLYRTALSPRLPTLPGPAVPARLTALPCCLKVKAKRNRRKHCRSREFCSLFDRNLEGGGQGQRSGEWPGNPGAGAAQISY